MIHLEPVRCEAAAALAASLSELHDVCFPDDPWPPQAIAEIITMVGVFGHIACEDAEVSVGFSLAQSLEAECEILTLGVVPARQRAGIGSVLLAAVIDEARRRGAQTLFLEVAEDNIAARVLYASHGFVQIGRRANYYRRLSGRADALVLRLLLAT